MPITSRRAKYIINRIIPFDLISLFSEAINELQIPGGIDDPPRMIE